jgi:Family of unknown function (DUF5709)
MSDQPGTENLDDDLGSYSVDPEDQLQPEDTLEGGGDPLDEGYSPPDAQDRRTEWGTTAYEQSQDETIEQRIMQEEPDPNSAYGAPDDEGGLDRENRGEDRLGGDDEDSIPVSEDFLGEDDSVDEPAGRLVAPDEGAHEDMDAEMDAEEYPDTGGESAEEAAMRIVEGE